MGPLRMANNCKLGRNPIGQSRRIETSLVISYLKNLKAATTLAGRQFQINVGVEGPNEFAYNLSFLSSVESGGRNDDNVEEDDNRQR